MGVILENLSYMLRGLQLTVVLAGLSMAGSFFGGLFLAMARLSHMRWLRWPARAYVDVVRTVPLIMVIFWVFFLFPVVTGQATTPVKAALFALVIFNSSYMAEVIRAGIQSIPRGQTEAARATGLNYFQTMRHVILPQALKNMTPALVNRFIAVFMGTSLAYIIGVTEFFRAANNVNNRVYRSYEIYSFVALVYFLCCYSLSLLSRWVEGRMLGASSQLRQAAWRRPRHSADEAMIGRHELAHLRRPD